MHYQANYSDNNAQWATMGHTGRAVLYCMAYRKHTDTAHTHTHARTWSRGRHQCYKSRTAQQQQHHLRPSLPFSRTTRHSRGRGREAPILRRRNHHRHHRSSARQSLTRLIYSADAVSSTARRDAHRARDRIATRGVAKPNAKPARCRCTAICKRGRKDTSQIRAASHAGNRDGVGAPRPCRPTH